MKLNVAKRFAGGLALAGAFALTGVVGLAQTGAQGQDGQQPRAERGERHGRKGGFGRRGGFGGERIGGPFGRLNLTDAQKEQMQQIAERFRQSTEALRAQGRGERGEGFDAFKGGSFNESAVRAAAQARANRQVELEVARARMMYEMYNVLTPDQKAQLETLREQREQRRQEFRSRRNANPGEVQ